MINEPENLQESRLTKVLNQLPGASVPSNFTARVLAAIDREEARRARSSGRAWWNWRQLWPRFAVAAAIVFLTGISLQRYETNLQRTALAKNLAMVTHSPLPGVEALENLDAIQRMSQSGHADTELLAALQ